MAPNKYPPKVFFSEKPKNIEIQNFDPPPPPRKRPEPTYMWKYQSTPPPLWGYM